MWDSLLLLMAGFIGGLISGLSGIGTGILLILAIPIALENIGMEEGDIIRFTLANTVFGTLCSSLMNNLSSLRHGRFYPKPTFWVAGAAVICASLVLEFFVKRIVYPPLLYNSLITLFLLYILYRGFHQLRAKSTLEENLSKPKLIFTGLVGGLVAALTGLGGGSVAIPLINVWMRADIKKAKVIAYGMVFSIAALLTLLNLIARPVLAQPISHTGYIIFPIALPLSLGIIVGAPLGVFFSEKLSSRTISYVFLSFIGLATIKKAYAIWQEISF